MSDAATLVNDAALQGTGATLVPTPNHDDLPRRLSEDLPLNAPVPDTFYGGDESGYTDYPAYA